MITSLGNIERNLSASSAMNFILAVPVTPSANDAPESKS